MEHSMTQGLSESDFVPQYKRNHDFWESKSSTVGGMMLLSDADTLDEAEKADILSQLPSLSQADVLELGAGIGRYTSHFIHMAHHVTVVDFVEKFVEENRRTTSHCNNTSYHCANVMDLEFHDSSFDFIFINWLFMYLDDTQAEELRDCIHRWLREKGKVFFRESCFVGSTGTPPPPDNPTRYRSDTYYTRLFETHFVLQHRGNIKVYEERYHNPHQHYWLFQK